ncbi:MAG: hypothetical protein COA44_01255 [Arcobacter sp.]|nr:MAG: hypothetical protein COA44_01255 [Arcobacter sp.]
MADINEQKNKDQVLAFLKNNDIDPSIAMGNQNKFITMYFVEDKRLFSEETRIGFNIEDDSDINVHFFEIIHMDFETSFKIKEHDFNYDEEKETLSITGTNSKIHKADYKVVIHSIYLDF